MAVHRAPLSGTRDSHPRTVARRVAFIVFAQRVGLSLDEVRAELDRLPRDRAPTGEDWARLTGAWRARIDGRIAELERLRGSLTTCIGCGCLSLAACAVLNPDDRAGAGAGAALLDRRDAVRCPQGRGRLVRRPFTAAGARPP